MEVDPTTVRSAPQGRQFGRTLRRFGRSVGPTIVLFIFLLAIWEIVVVVGHPKSYILPSPLSVVQALGDFSQWHWFTAAAVTSTEVVGGFILSGILGVLIGIVVTWSDTSRQAILPFLVVFNSLPKIALAPLFIIWLGYGIWPNIWIAFLISFFPVAINTARGLMETDTDFMDLAHLLRAKRWRIYAMIRIPHALPYIFTGLKIATTEAVVGAIIGEFIASSAGLASLIMSAQASLSSNAILAALVWISALGFLLYGIVSLLEYWLMPWTRTA